MTKSKTSSKAPKAVKTASSSTDAKVALSSPSDVKLGAKIPASRIKAVSLLHDEQAGVRLLKHSRFKQTQLRFERKLPSDVAQHLRRTGWVWRPAEGVYTRQFGSSGESAAIDEAMQLYNELCLKLSASQLVTDDA